MISEIAKSILLPSNLLTLLLLLSFALWLMRFHRQAMISALLACCTYFFFGSGPVAQYLLSGLEYRYPAYSDNMHTLSKPTIVVLTGDAEIKPDVPLTSYINTSSAYRILEARRIHNLYPESKIIITGIENVPELMKQVLVTLGVDAEIIHLDNLADSTYKSAVNLHSQLSDEEFILVTSAGHMPRAMAVFETQGTSPIPAPTEFISQRNILAAQYLPVARHLVYSELAMHEYLAIAWYRLNGMIKQPE